MLDLANGWSLDVERGPDWLFIRLHCDPDHMWDTPPLAETLWSLLERHFAHRLVLECDDLSIMPSELLGQLVLLQKKIVTHGGQLRITGLSPAMREALHISRLDQCLQVCSDRAEALMGDRPCKPR